MKTLQGYMIKVLFKICSDIKSKFTGFLGLFAYRIYTRCITHHDYTIIIYVQALNIRSTERETFSNGIEVLLFNLPLIECHMNFIFRSIDCTYCNDVKKIHRMKSDKRNLIYTYYIYILYIICLMKSYQITGPKINSNVGRMIILPKT